MAAKKRAPKKSAKVIIDRKAFDAMHKVYMLLFEAASSDLTGMARSLVAADKIINKTFVNIEHLDPEDAP